MSDLFQFCHDACFSDLRELAESVELLQLRNAAPFLDLRECAQLAQLMKLRGSTTVIHLRDVVQFADIGDLADLVQLGKFLILVETVRLQLQLAFDVVQLLRASR